jgi:hypothetical protein
MKHGRMGSIIMIMIQSTIFNNCLVTFLRKFYANFPKKRTTSMQNPKACLTTGKRASCINKRKLYLLNRENNDRALEIYYKNYCKILSKVIILAKRNFTTRMN